MTDDEQMIEMIKRDVRLGMQAQSMGRDANLLVQQLRSLPPALVEAFMTTNYSVTLDGNSHVLNIARSMPDALTDALAAKAIHSLTVITAWNPYSRELHPDENHDRQAVLASVLQLRGDSCFEAEGKSQDGSWTEASLAVANLSHDTAAALGLIFQQHAIVFCETGSVAELVPCSPLTDTP